MAKTWSHGVQRQLFDPSARARSQEPSGRIRKATAATMNLRARYASALCSGRTGAAQSLEARSQQQAGGGVLQPQARPQKMTPG